MPPEFKAEDHVAAKRLGGLLGYVEQLIKLDERPAARLSQHKLADGSQFILHQHELYGLPGVTFDSNDGDGPIWLCMERLQRSNPPEIAEDYRAWIDISGDPFKLPMLRQLLHTRVLEDEKDRLIETGEARPGDCSASTMPAQQDELPGLYFDVMLRLEDRPQILEALESYCSGAWSEWSEKEKPRRRSIAVYQRLFETAQRLLQSGGTESIELVWGMGIARWSRPEESVDLPMIERGVEIEIADEGDAAITMRPRATPARVELRPFEKLASNRLVMAEDAARRCLRGIETGDADGVSPFKRETFEPILKICGNQLDPEGRYLPDQHILPDADPVPPAEGGFLTVSDRYVIFARRRSTNAVLHDIERFKEVLSPSEGTPPVLDGAAKTLVMGPGDGIGDIYEPLEDKIGASDSLGSSSEAEPVDPEHGDLFFPKPFNDDQVQIIRRLEKSDGLVVQGPPGTGKTHTIANIISHMLATGRRVLVISHGETALKVIRDQLPEGVRDLTISVAGSDREGLKQVEKAINLMLGIVNLIDGNHQRQRNLIRNLETDIVKNRKRLADIDARISGIAAKHLSIVPGGSETPYQVALKVIEEHPLHAWFTDRPDHIFGQSGIDETIVPRLFNARRHVGGDLKFIGERLPSPANLPCANTILEWHRDLIAARSLTDSIAATEPLLRRVVTRLGVDGAEALATALKEHADLMTALSNEPWVWALIERQASEPAAIERVRPAVDAFIADASEQVAERTGFVSRPVFLPSELPPPPHREVIFNALVQGKNPFGLLAIALRPYRDVIGQIRVAGLPPDGAEAWHHVRAYAIFHAKLISLSSRWASLRAELLVSEDVHFSWERPSALDVIAERLRFALIDYPSTVKEIAGQLANAVGSADEASAIVRDYSSIAKFGNELAAFVSARRLGAVKDNLTVVADQFRASSCGLATNATEVLQVAIGNPGIRPEQLEHVWTALRAKLSSLRDLERSFRDIAECSAIIAEAGAKAWSERLLTEPASAEDDPVAPGNWKSAWDWATHLSYLEDIGASSDLSALHSERIATEKELREGFAKLVKERTFFNLAASMKGTAKAALNAFAQTIHRIGKGTGKGAVLHRQDARNAMERCYDAVPCWIMPTWRVSEQLPAAFGTFDLVILDEASQSDVRELPALLRGKKILVVGDDRQVSPSAAFLSIANIQRLRANFLAEFPFKGQVEPGASLYDLARVMFPDKFVMLKEHFRCVEPIIRFSMQFYDESLVPLRVPTSNERLDPPLVDIFVEDGERRGKSKVNPPEAEIIVDEIERIIADPHLSLMGGDERQPRSIGVVSLIGSEQAAFIQKRLMDRVGEAAMVRHRIVCGDSATFQGDERDIVFLSMIADRKRKQSQTAMQYEQRFNVALSRARDRMVLVRSVAESDLNPNDLKARVIRHFDDPMPGHADADAALIDLCQSGFERDLFTVLVEKGYRVIPQVGSEGFSIDMVVEGESGRRLAIECDGDLYHGPDRWANDMRRQRILERAGWTFWRCFGSNYTLDREGVLADLLQTLDRMGIAPAGAKSSCSEYTEHRVVRAMPVIDAAEDDDEHSSVSTLEDSAVEFRPDPEATLLAGDRIVIRYLDDLQSRQECYVLTDKSSDPINGLVSLSSPLATALSEASPGDEITFQLDGRERAVLFMSLGRERGKPV